MARSSLLSDDLVRQLVAVGQVDILVGLPTFNHAATAAVVVRTLHVGLARHFPRERTVLINPDGGSDDGTVDLVRNAPMADEEMRGSSSLRTTHRVSATYPGLPGRAGGVRTVFAAADLLQARAVVLIDADVSSMTPDWVAELARPVWNDEAELVLPIHPRHRYDGPLLSQLVRPLLGTVYARPLQSSLAGGFGCSGRLAARMVSHPMWERELTGPELAVWLVTTALAEALRLIQVHLGPCMFGPRPARAGLREVFEQVVGTAFGCIERDAATWLGRTEFRDAPSIGAPREPAGAETPVDPAPMAERFRTGVRDLAPLLRDILRPATLARLHSAAAAGDAIPSIPDSLWVTTVYEFITSVRRGVMNREHLTQALVPLYLGRTASFFAEIASAEPSVHEQRLAALEGEYRNLRPYLIEQWNHEGGR